MNHPLDRQILRSVRDALGMPIRLWTIVEQIVDARKPPSRQERRRLRGEILDRVGSLIRQKYIERVGSNREMVRLRQRELSAPQKVPIPPDEENQ